MASVVSSTSALKVSTADSPNDRLTVTFLNANRSSGTVYYKAAADVSASSNDGSLAPGAALTLDRATTWFLAAPAADGSPASAQIAIAPQTEQALVRRPDQTTPNILLRVDPSSGFQSSVDHGTSWRTPGPLFNVKDYGAKGDGTTDDTAAIQAAFTAAGAASGTADVVFPASTAYQTTGGHTIPPGVKVVCAGRRQVINHRGTGPCFILRDETSAGRGCGLENAAIIGSAAGVAAVAGGIGVELRNGSSHRLRNVYCYGFIGDANSCGVKLHNTAPTNGVNFVGFCVLDQVEIVNCSKLLRFECDVGGGAGTSFGYTDIRSIKLAAYASQLAISVGAGSDVYASTIQGNLVWNGDNAVGIDVENTAILGYGTWLHLLAELGAGPPAGLKRIYNRGRFECNGKFWCGGTQPADDTASATFHSFMEDTPSQGEMTSIDNFVVASAAFGMTFPAGSFFEVSGTTNITGLGSSWEGRIITLKFQGSLTVQVSGNIRLNGGVAFAATANDCLTLVQRSGTWYEVARSIN